MLIQSNLLAGGALTLYCSSGTVSNYQVLDNHFTTRHKSTVGWFETCANCGGKSQSGNVIQETRQPLTLD